MTARNGTRYILGATAGQPAVEDTNGNYLSFTNPSNPNGYETDWTGTTGQVLIKDIVESSGCTNPVTGASAPQCEQVEVAEPGGTYQSFIIVDASVSAATGACGSVTGYSGTSQVPAYVVLPEYTAGSSWYYQFGYDGAGRLNYIRYPTGGVTTFSYGSLCTFNDGTVDSVSVTTNDAENHTGTTTYTRSSATFSEIDRPDGSRTLVSYDGNGLPTDVKKYDTDGSTLLSEVVSTNTAGTPEFPATAVTYLNGTKISERDTQFDSSGDLTQSTQIDWARDPSGNTKRTTAITYYAPGKPSQITVSEGGATYAQTTIAYDNYASPSGLVNPTTSLANHDSAYSTSYTSRDNPTEISRFVNGSSALNTYLAYDTGGNVVSTTTPNGHPVTAQYNQCGGTFPSSISVPGGSQTLTNDCYTGLLTNRQDANGQITNYGYDSFGRPHTVSTPDGGGTTLTYPSPNQVESQPKITSTITGTGYTLADGYGRTIFQQTAVPTGKCDTIETIRDNMGRSADQSSPYNTTCGSPARASTFSAVTRDGLGRLKIATAFDGSQTNYSYNASATEIATPGGTPARILERDGWGDLWQVCELSAQSGNTACGLAIGGNGFLTQYTHNPLGLLTSVSQHGETRSFAYDWFGRMTSETTPEAGTTSFTFDSSGTCGSTAGSLVERVDNAGNVTCYGHDGWGRVTAITYPSGPNAAATPAKTFVYDSANVDGVSMSSSVGRLAEAYTGPANAKITDEGFGYDKVGRPSEFYEATPSSGGYYAVGESWWLDGQPASLSAPGVPTITYNPDSAGRVTSISASSGQNPASAVSYFPSQQVQTVTFGSGDYDTYALDADLRLSSYTLDINGQNDTGSLVWNGNNTLKSLAISDPFATGDTQSCSYTQDDLGRLASVNCGSEWSQTYTPDSFGNQFTPSGGSNPLVASFNGNNQFSSVSGFVPNYNADGDLLDDPTGGGVRNAYAWDAEGKLVGLDGTTQVFDALGRLVQNSAGGEALYTPAGQQFGDMEGQAVNWEVFPTPGGGAAVYNSAGLDYYAHADWLGSWRLASSPSRVFGGDEAYSPYGTAYAGTGPQVFTGKFLYLQGPYQFPFRAESPALKRWLSPDPAGLAAVNPADPQSWNQYAYVGNQPLANVDPLGLDDCNWHLDPGGGTLTCPYGGGAPVPPGPAAGPGGADGCGRSGGYCPGGGGGGWPAPPLPPAPVPKPPSIWSRFKGWASSELACTDKAADKYSIAGGLHALGVANGGGLGTTIVNAALGNPISGLFGGFDRSAAGTTILLSGTYLGFGGEGLVQEGLAGTAIEAGARGLWSSVTGAGETFTTLFSGEASLASTTITAAEAASGVGLGIIGYDALSWAASALVCAGRQ